MPEQVYYAPNAIAANVASTDDHGTIKVGTVVEAALGRHEIDRPLTIVKGPEGGVSASKFADYMFKETTDQQISNARQHFDTMVDDFARGVAHDMKYTPAPDGVELKNSQQQIFAFRGQLERNATNPQLPIEERIASAWFAEKFETIAKGKLEADGPYHSNYADKADKISERLMQEAKLVDNGQTTEALKWAKETQHTYNPFGHRHTSGEEPVTGGNDPAGVYTKGLGLIRGADTTTPSQIQSVAAAPFKP